MKAIIVISILIFISFRLSAQSAYRGSIGDGYAQASQTITVNETGLISSNNEISLKAISLRRGEALPISTKNSLVFTNAIGQRITVENSNGTLPEILPIGLFFLIYINEENISKTLVINVL